jgi:hypothetical protein
LEAQASTARPRYTLIDQHISFLFSNHDALPFQIISEMCWDSTQGFCDEDLSNAEELYTLIDWYSGAHGAIFQTGNGACFWWGYQPEYGSDNNPHINEHYWVSCPEGIRP